MKWLFFGLGIAVGEVVTIILISLLTANHKTMKQEKNDNDII